MKVVVLTTSYPRFEIDPTGIFVRDLVEAARDEGLEIDVVLPEASFPNFGIAYGYGVVGNLRRRPWLVLVLPLFLAAFVRAARRAARDADVVHAHWLPTGFVAAATRKPFVLQLWGTDVELARRLPWAFRWVVRRARAVLVGSEYLAASARELGAREVRVVPVPIAVRDDVGDPLEPPHVLFLGRFAPEKGIHEFLAATEGLPRVLVGSGPVDVPEADGFAAPFEVDMYYEEAAVVCVPSRREGYGMVAREAMANARPVVATRVGGLADAIEDGITGVLVPPGDIAALREAIERLLGDPEERERLGAAARERIREHEHPRFADLYAAVTAARTQR